MRWNPEGHADPSGSTAFDQAASKLTLLRPLQSPGPAKKRVPICFQGQPMMCRHIGSPSPSCCEDILSPVSCRLCGGDEIRRYEVAYKGSSTKGRRQGGSATTLPKGLQCFMAWLVMHVCPQMNSLN